MTSSNKEQGNSLEEAVQTIESIIFSQQPGLKESNFIFERNKIVTLKGGRSEIDLYVQVEFGKGYNSIYIFECKNWSKKVGKNDIVIFSEKIKELNAQKGFFIANEYTIDAIKRADQDGRIELVKAKKEFRLDTFPIEFYSPTISPVKVIMKGNVYNTTQNSDHWLS